MKILLTIITNKIKSLINKLRIRKRWFRLKNYQMDTRYGSKTPRIFVLTAWSVLLTGMLAYICYQAFKSESEITTIKTESETNQNQSTFDMIMDLFEEEQ